MKTVLDIPRYAGYSTVDPLEVMFNIRYNLNKILLDKNKIPQWPLPLAIARDHQVFLIDLLGWTVEEMFEAFEEIDTLSRALSSGDKPKDQCMSILEAFNEELADVMLFLLELMSFMNIGIEDVGAYYNRLLGEKNLDSIRGSNTLDTAIAYARYCNTEAGYHTIMIKRAKYKLMGEDEVTNDFQQAGRSTSVIILDEHQNLIFNCVRYINKIRQLIKTKYWDGQDTYMPPVYQLQAYIMELFLHWMCYLEFVEATPESIFQTYYRKTEIIKIRNGQG